MSKKDKKKSSHKITEIINILRFIMPVLLAVTGIFALTDKEILKKGFCVTALLVLIIGIIMCVIFFAKFKYEKKFDILFRGVMFTASGVLILLIPSHMELLSRFVTVVILLVAVGDLADHLYLVKNGVSSKPMLVTLIIELAGGILLMILSGKLSVKITGISLICFGAISLLNSVSYRISKRTV